jgi:hypothetical protein
MIQSKYNRMPTAGKFRAFSGQIVSISLLSLNGFIEEMEYRELAFSGG